MAKMGEKRQLKRFAMTKAVDIPIKSHTWTTKSGPGPHPADLAIPLRILIRDIINLARNAKESDSIIYEGKVAVDGRIRRNPKFSVGIMDVITISDIGKNYRVLIDDHRRLNLVEIAEDESKIKLCKVIGKKTVRGNKIQLNLHDGRNLIGDFREFRKGDVLQISLENSQILRRLTMKESAFALIVGGKNTGKTGKIVEIKKIGGSGSNVVLECNGEKVETQGKYVFVVGEESPLIKLLGE